MLSYYNVIVLFWSVQWAVAIRPPVCHSDNCKLMSPSTSFVGEYVFQILDNGTISIDAVESGFSIKLYGIAHCDVEVPSYDRHTTFPSVQVEGWACTWRQLSALLKRLNVSAPQLTLVAWNSSEPLDQHSFSNYTHLTKLSLESSSPGWMLPTSALHSLASLKWLSVSGACLVGTSALPNNLTNLQLIHVTAMNRQLPPLPSSLESLFLKNVSLYTLPVQSLPHLTQLHVDSCSLVGLPAASYPELTNLYLFNFPANDALENPVPLRQFAPKLKRVSLWNSPLLKLPNEWLGGLDTLIEVDLQYCSLLQLPADLLRLSRPVDVTVARCEALSNLPATLLDDQTSLESLDLSHNNHTSLPVNITSSLTALTTLKLSGNGLRQLDAQLFANLKQLQNLDLDWNEISYFPGNVFTSCPRLTAVNLSGNRLSGLSSLARSQSVHFPPALSHLDLSNNVITDFSAEQLQLSGKSLTINLNNNHISHVLWTDDGNGLTLLLGDNPLLCDADLYAYARSARLDKSAVCAAPPSLLHRSLADLSLEELEKRSERRCPRDCECTARPHTAMLVVNCSGVPRPQLESALVEEGFQLVLHAEHCDLGSVPALPPNVTELHVAHNHIQNLEPLPSELRVLDLADNPLSVQAANALLSVASRGLVWLSCDCGRVHVLDALLLASPHNQSGMQCAAAEGASSVSAARARCGGDAAASGGAAMAGAGVVAVVAVGLLLALYYRHSSRVKRWLRERGWCGVGEDWSRPYDVFVAAAASDASAASTLEWRLRAAGWSVSSDSSWQAGGAVCAQLLAAVQSARRTLLLVGRGGEEEVVGPALQAARQHARVHLAHRLLPVLLAEPPLPAAHPRLAAYLARHTHLHVEDPRFWDKLSAAMPSLHAKARRPPQPPAEHTLYV